MKKNLTLFHSLLWIIVSAVVVNVVAYFGIKGYQYWKKRGVIDYRVPIKAIVQTGPQKEALKTTYLAELLELSCDLPIFSSDFNLKEGQKKLLASPVIRSAEIKFNEPGILYVDYTTRQPSAFLADFENVALDEDRIPFPVTPFFTPKKLPEIYLGMEEEIAWNQPIKGEKIDLAFALLEILSSPIVSELFNVQRIDVSNAFEKSLGRREIVLLVEDRIYANYQGQEREFIFPRMLRLSPKKYAQELSNYLKLREQLMEKEKELLRCSDWNGEQMKRPVKTIDFRISQLAFIEEGGEHS